MGGAHGQAAEVGQADRGHRHELGRGPLGVGQVGLADLLADRHHDPLPADHRARAPARSPRRSGPSRARTRPPIGARRRLVRTASRSSSGEPDSPRACSSFVSALSTRIRSARSRQRVVDGDVAEARLARRGARGGRPARASARGPRTLAGRASGRLRRPRARPAAATVRRDLAAARGGVRGRSAPGRMPIRISMIRPIPFWPSFEPCARLTPEQVSSRVARIQGGGGWSPAGGLVELGVADRRLEDAAAGRRTGRSRSAARSGARGPTSPALAQFTPAAERLARQERVGQADAEDRRRSGCASWTPGAPRATSPGSRRSPRSAGP